MRRILSLMAVGCIAGCVIFGNTFNVEAEKYQYDDLNRVTEVVYENGSYVKYEYDKNGNIVKIEIYESKPDDPTQDTAGEPEEEEAAGESTAGESVTGESATGESVTGESTTEESVTEESATEDPGKGEEEEETLEAQENSGAAITRIPRNRVKPPEEGKTVPWDFTGKESAGGAQQEDPAQSQEPGTVKGQQTQDGAEAVPQEPGLPATPQEAGLPDARKTILDKLLYIVKTIFKGFLTVFRRISGRWTKG